MKKSGSRRPKSDQGSPQKATHSHAQGEPGAHSHPHVHGEPGEHAHSHAHGEPGALGGAERHREPLLPGSARGKTLFFDAASGVAGDMTIAALVDLGVPFQVVQEAVFALALEGVTLRLERAERSQIGATRFDVLSAKRQPERRYRDIDALIAKAKLSPDVKGLARAIFLRLGRAEATVHRIPLDDVHFHEVGAVDAIVDIVGAAACLSFLGADVVCSPLPLGRGFVECRHGVLPLPAPATLQCLAGVPTYDAGIEGELVTPTGAAIVATVAKKFASWPAIAPSRVGWGAGTRTLVDRPNALRVVLGDSTDEGRAVPFEGATHAVIEANVDDMTGEVAAHALAQILDAGALDVWCTPVLMKKGRPGMVLSALASVAEAPRIAEVVLRETTSIGVRLTAARRACRPRRVETVETRFGPVPVKVSSGPFGEPVVKPEFDACAALARKAGVAVRVVLDEALRTHATRTAR